MSKINNIKKLFIFSFIIMLLFMLATRRVYDPLTPIVRDGSEGIKNAKDQTSDAELKNVYDFMMDTITYMNGGGTANDGYVFLDNYDEFNDDSPPSDGSSIDNETLKINDYMYTNYTLDDTVFCDVDFTKFWHITDEEEEKIKEERKYYENSSHMELFEMHAGDYGYDFKGNTDNGAGKTLTTRGGYDSTPRITAVKEYFDANYGGENANNNPVKINQKLSKGGNIFTTFDGRICAAFPMAAIMDEESYEFLEVRQNMNKINEYKLQSNGEVKYTGPSANAGTESIYRYVDCVFENSKSNQQYVVPFVIVDSKALHNHPHLEHFLAPYTDNRYGQVYEYIGGYYSKGDNPQEYLDAKTVEKYTLDGKIDNTGTNANKYKLDESDFMVIKNGRLFRDHSHVPKTITPIEPYTNGGTNPGIRNSILRDPTDRLISMRVYDRTFANLIDVNKTNNSVEPQKNNIQDDNYFTQRKKTFKSINVTEEKFFKEPDDTNELVKYWDDGCDCDICRNGKRGE